MVATCLRAPGLTEVTGTGTAAWGRQGVEGENQWTEGGVGHMRMPADDSGLTCRSYGRTGGRTGSITPTKVVMCDTLSSAVCLDLRAWCDLSYPSILRRIFLLNSRLIQG